jgi:hypothetical protein
MPMPYIGVRENQRWTFARMRGGHISGEEAQPKGAEPGCLPPTRFQPVLDKLHAFEMFPGFPIYLCRVARSLQSPERFHQPEMHR